MPQIAPLRGAYVRCFRQGHGVAHSDSSNGSGSGSPAGRIAREVSSLQASLLARLHQELGGRPDRFAAAAQRLAADFGSVTATAVDAAYEPAFAATPGWDFATGIGTINAYNLVFSPLWAEGP